MRMEQISTTNTSPLYSISSNPQSCSEMNSTTTCILTWSINATGPVNSTVLVDVLFSSNFSRVVSKMTQNTTINITENTIPLITLYEPANRSKLLGNGTITFIWRVEDDGVNVSCDLYINEVLNLSTTCLTNVNTTYSVNLFNGYYNWSVNVTDLDNNTATSPTYYFYTILDHAVKATKMIRSENINQYIIKSIVEKLMNTTTFNYIDFVENSFTPGSFNRLYNFSNSTPQGDVLGWNVNESEEINYSVTGVGDYNLDELFIVGLE